MTARALLEAVADELQDWSEGMHPVCDFIDRIRTIASSLEGQACSHEPFQGRCIHCDVAFKDGRPVGQPVRCDAIPKHDWQELSCEQNEYEPTMESGYKRCTRCGTRVHFSRARTPKSEDKPA